MNKILILIMAVFCSVAVQAKSIVCAGTVTKLSYHSPNKFMIQLSSMNRPVFFCDASQEWTLAGGGRTTSPEACNTLYSTFLAAKLSNTIITNMYFDGDDVPDSCDAWDSWVNANIRHYLF